MLGAEALEHFEFTFVCVLGAVVPDVDSSGIAIDSQRLQSPSYRRPPLRDTSGHTDQHTI